jgi:MYXO-CTERM domain-containing protein
VNAVRAEARKLLTLPSLRLTALLTWSGAVLLAYVDAPDPLSYCQAGFLVLGVLAAASEHQGGGQIRTTLLAMPRRLPLYAAKAGTLAAVTLPVAAVAAVISGEVARAPAATGYLILTTLVGAAAGGLVRRAVPAVMLVLVVYFVAGPLLRDRFAAYLPDTAVVDPSRGAAATVIWAAAALGLAALAFHRRDA